MRRATERAYLVVGDSQRGECAPLVALWLRVTQIVFHHADEGAAQR
jgi:hypothetical protein